MNEIIARKVVNEKGEEIIELDLNKPWPKRSAERYPSYKDEIEKFNFSERKQRKTTKEFISVVN